MLSILLVILMSYHWLDIRIMTVCDSFFDIDKKKKDK